MLAVRLHDSGDLRTEQVPAPRPGSGEAVVRVEACGVCGSDLHFVDGTARTGHTPITLGHEVAGVVEDPGESPHRTGAPVVIRVGTWCGDCPRCREGRINLCQRAEVLGIDRDGGLAEEVAVPADMVIARPPGLDPATAASAVDAGATALHAVTRTGGIRKGESAAVIGVGGLGGYALQFARSRGAGPVIAVDRDEQALARAEALGADETVLATPGGSVGRAVKLLTEGGVDVAFEFVGLSSTVDAAVKCLRPGGRAIAAGVGIEPLTTLPPVLWSNNEYTLTGSYGSLPGDAEAVLAELAAGSVEPPALETVALAGAAEAILRRASAGGGTRLVVVP